MCLIAVPGPAPVVLKTRCPPSRGRSPPVSLSLSLLHFLSLSLFSTRCLRAGALWCARLCVLCCAYSRSFNPPSLLSPSPPYAILPLLPSLPFVCLLLSHCIIESAVVKSVCTSLLNNLPTYLPQWPSLASASRALAQNPTLGPSALSHPSRPEAYLHALLVSPVWCAFGKKMCLTSPPWGRRTRTRWMSFMDQAAIKESKR